LGSALDRLESFRLALQTSPTGVVVTDHDGTILFVNAELERIFGYSKDELLERPVDSLVPDMLRDLHAADPQAFAASGSARRMGAGGELMGRRKDGSLVAIEAGLTPMTQGTDLLILASIVDVSDRLQIEASRRAALEDQLAFERLLAQFSLQCINMPDEQVPTAITQILREIGEWLALDRCSFFRLAADDTIFDPLVWTAPGVAGVDGPIPAREMFPWALNELLAGHTVSFSELDELPDERDRAGFAQIGARAGVYVPLAVDGRVAGTVGFVMTRQTRLWTPDLLERLRVIASVFGQVIARLERDAVLRTAHAEVQRLKDRLQAENVYLRREERERLGVTRIVGQSAAVMRVIDQIRQVAATDSTVLLLGETGTGKELFATQIHELSARHNKAMVRVNCGAIPATLIESELFGREKGAFTGALARQAGRFELADHSTIFLDEIGDLPQDVQVKLLRVLEERTIERLGSPRPITVDTRIIAATHRNLEQRVQEGIFREDLYYRLNVFPISVPPLRDRAEDIPLLVWRFVEEFSKAFAKRVDSIEKDSLSALQQYHWPGNIRELRNTVERAMIVATSRKLTIPLPHSAAAAPRRSTKLVDVEREHIRSVLESTRWRIRGAGGAADRLALKPTTLETRMAKLGIRRPKEP
jgi:formate hydrogenlyase transcriptional activator